MANSNFYTMTPYSTWAMPKLDWNLIYGAGAIQQARGDKAEQKYSDFVTLHDNLKLHEKYNESYQNWRTQTDTELDNLINNHGGKLGTVGFNRDLDRLIGSKRNDPWIKNAIQSSEQAKLYEENILRNPDIKPYNDPNATAYLSWLEDSTPTFKYKGFYKDAPPSTWFGNKAKEFSPEKWTEFADFGQYGTLTTQHDKKDADKIAKGFEDLKEQFNKTPEGEQLKRMYDAGEFGNLTYDQVFATYAKGAASVVAYDNTSSTASENIDQKVERELDKLKKENDLKQQQLNIMKKNVDSDAEYKRRMAAVSERNAATNEAETAYKMMYGTSSNGGWLNNAAADELVVPLVVEINRDQNKYDAWRNGKTGNKFTYTMNTLTGGANSIENKILENVQSGKVSLKTQANKEVSTAPISAALKYVDPTYKLGLNKEISLVREDQGDFSVQVGYETPLLTRKQRDELIDEYNSSVDKNQRLKESDFTKFGSSYKLTMVGTDGDLKSYFQDASGAPAVKGSAGKIPNNINFSPTPPATQQTNTTQSNTTQTVPTSTQPTVQQQKDDSLNLARQKESADSLAKAQELARATIKYGLEEGRFVFMDNTAIGSNSSKDFGLNLTKNNVLDFSYTSEEGLPTYTWDGNNSMLYEDGAGQTFIGIMDDAATNHRYKVENVEKYKTPENLVIDHPAIKDKNFEVSFIRNTGNDQKTVYIGQKNNGDRISTSMNPGEMAIVLKANNDGSVTVFKAPSMDELLYAKSENKQIAQEKFIKEHSDFEKVLRALSKILTNNN